VTPAILRFIVSLLRFQRAGETLSEEFATGAGWESIFGFWCLSDCLFLGLGVKSGSAGGARRAVFLVFSYLFLDGQAL
jgi:hypothetical protein